jgi:phosphoglucomutase/phosphomannomutase
LVDYLDQLAKSFGHFRHEGVSLFMRGVQGKAQMAKMLDSLRAEPLREAAGLAVTHFEDLRDPNGRLGPLKGATDAASRNVLLFRFGDKARIALRPSGTEPKAKAYVEVCSDPCPSDATPEAWAATCRAVDELLPKLSADFVRQALARVGLDPSAQSAK